MTMMKACMFKTGNTEEDGEDGVKVTKTIPDCSPNAIITGPDRHDSP